MSDSNQLAATGGSMFTLFGIAAYSGWWLAIAAGACIILGVTGIRLGWRSGRRAGER